MPVTLHHLRDEEVQRVPDYDHSNLAMAASHVGAMFRASNVRRQTHCLATSCKELVCTDF